jgi:anti-sigma-K factor RskA
MNASHDELMADVAAYVLGSLDPHARHAFETHLAECAECTSQVRALRDVTDALALAVPQRTPRPELRARVLASVLGPTEGSAKPPLMPPEAATSARTGFVFGWLPLAALLILTLGLGAYAVRLSMRVSDLEARLEQAILQASAAEGALADARRATADAQSAMAVLVAPDLARIDLAGQAVAPQARARALWSRSSGMVFTVSNLPSLPDGRVYQVWVVTNTAPISAGLLMPDPTGRGMAFFSTPPDIPAPVAVAVTLEPAGGVPAPTGERYLIGMPGAAL